MSSPRIPLVVVPVALGLVIGGAIIVHRRGGPSPEPARSGVLRMAPGTGLVISSDRLDFGVMEIGKAVMRPLLLRNSGSAPLHVNIQATGSGWTVEPAQLNLEPGGIERVQVIGTRTDDGALEGSIRISTGGSDDSALVVALAGGGTMSAEAIAQNPSAAGIDAASGAVYGAIDPRTGAPVAPGASAANGGVQPGGSTLPGGVSVSRSYPGPSMNPGSAPSATGSPTAAAAPGSSAIVPFDPANARLPRRISDRPAGSDGAKGEEPIPLNPRNASRDPLSDPTNEPPAAGVSALVVSPSSTLQLLGTRNQFYAQQISVTGSPTGGSFSLGSPLQIPKIPLAFGQFVQFSQSGSAMGSFDSGSGQVTMQLPIAAVDSNGNTAPLVFAMTTGTIVTRNPNGVLVSVTGQPRSADGQFRMVGIAKIPTGFRNGAEQQLVTIDVVGSLTFASSASARNDSAAARGAQENL